MKGVCAKIYMLGSFGQNGIDSLQSGFACFLKYFFLFVCYFVSLFVAYCVFSPKPNICDLQAHWKKGWRFGEQLPSHIYIFPSLLLFLSSYPEFHFPMTRVVSLAWAPEYCGGKGHKSRAGHSLNGTAVVCAVVWGWVCVITYPALCIAQSGAS